MRVDISNFYYMVGLRDCKSYPSLPYLFHDHSLDGGRHPSILSCKLPAVTRETKPTLSIALHPKSKLTLERGTNPTNRDTRVILVAWSEPEDLCEKRVKLRFKFSTRVG